MQNQAYSLFQARSGEKSKIWKERGKGSTVDDFVVKRMKKLGSLEKNLKLPYVSLTIEQTVGLGIPSILKSEIDCFESNGHKTLKARMNFFQEYINWPT